MKNIDIKIELNFKFEENKRNLRVLNKLGQNYRLSKERG